MTYLSKEIHFFSPFPGLAVSVPNCRAVSPIQSLLYPRMIKVTGSLPIAKISISTPRIDYQPVPDLIAQPKPAGSTRDGRKSRIAQGSPGGSTSTKLVPLLPANPE